MIINFLQSRKPAILPSLHQRPHLKLPRKDGLESTFADDINALKGYGKKNQETLGQLLFNFFRFYGHEFDYDKLVISVRNGKQISKVEKGWHLANNNSLCVEEPFNTIRNLGNTADETSFRGLHLELRRAFDLVSTAQLEECCEQYEFPKEEKLQRDRKTATPKPAIIRSASQSHSSRGGRGGSHRGGRHNNSHNRNGNNNRRASSSNFENHPGFIPIPGNLSAHETWLQQQAQAQLHNDLFQTYSVLQAQENSLRQQLYNQSQMYLQAQNGSQAYGPIQNRTQGNGAGHQQPSDRNRTASFDQPPLTAPIRPEFYLYPLNYHPHSMYGYQSPSTNPSSPSLSSAVPELRRSVHRSSVTNGSGGQPNSSLRSHSQPAARTGPSPLSLQPGMANPGLGIYQPFRQQINGVPIPNFIADENSDPGFETTSESLGNTPPEEHPQREYVGYYVNGSGLNTIRRQSAAPLSIPTFGDIQQSRRRLSTDQLPQSVLDRLKRPSRSPSPLGHDRSYSIGAHSAPLTAVSSQQGISNNNLRVFNNQNPPVVNGSNIPAPISIPHWQASVSEGSEDHSVDIDVSRSPAAGSEISSDQDLSGQLTPRDTRSEKRLDTPMVVNGSTSGTNEAFPAFTSPPVVNGASPRQLSTPNGRSPPEFVNGAPRLSPNSRTRLALQVQNGGMSPLDIGMSQNEVHRDDLPHLSPVYETRTPSPTANRKFEPGLDRKSSTTTIKGEKAEASKPGSKLGPANGNQMKQVTSDVKSNGHTRGSKSEGNGLGNWQKIPKNKKKGGLSEVKSTAQGQVHGEKPPNDNSERKGG